MVVCRSVGRPVGRLAGRRPGLLPSSALAPASAWAELVLVPNNPGRPAYRPTTIRNSTFHQLLALIAKSKVIYIDE